eukprot:734036-Hanusia_phi.AAC.1
MASVLGWMLTTILEDGTCVTVNPALLRLLPSFKGSQLSTQIISVPNGKWRQSEIGPHICEAGSADSFRSHTDLLLATRARRYRCFNGQRCTKQTSTSRLCYGWIECFGSDSNRAVTLDAMRVVLVSKQNAKKSFHGMGMNMGMSMAIGSLTGNLPTQFASPQVFHEIGMDESPAYNNKKMHGGGHLLPTRPLLQPGQLFQQQQQQQQQGQSLHSSHAVNIIASPSQQMQMQ